MFYRFADRVFRNPLNRLIQHMQSAKVAKILGMSFILTVGMLTSALLPVEVQAHEIRPDRRAAPPRAVRAHPPVRFSSVVVAPVVRVGPPAYTYYPGWYFDPYWGWRYSSPRVIVPVPGPVVPMPAPVYVERADIVPPPPPVPAPAGPVAGYWYWCASPAGYHPTVADCPGGWMAVAPQSRP